MPGWALKRGLAGHKLGAGLKLPLNKGGGFSLAGFMAAQSDGFWEDFSETSRLFQNTDEATPVTTIGQSIGRVNDRRTGANSPRNATQSTTGFKPTYQTTGAKFDGSDDNLITGYLFGSDANFLIAKVTVPASVPATQVICGAQASATTTGYIGVGGTGAARFGCGGLATNFGADLRGTTAIIGMSQSAGVVRLFSQNQVSETSYTGAPTTATALRIGAFNNAGTASNFFGGSVKKVLAGRGFIDLATFNQIASQL